MTTTPRPRPTSPRPRPKAAGRPQNATSPLAPLPVGGEVALEPNRYGSHQDDIAPPTRGEVTNEPCNTCTTYLRNRIHVLMRAIEQRGTPHFGHTAVLRHYMLKVHTRHLTGGSLATPTTDALGNALP